MSVDTLRGIEDAIRAHMADTDPDESRAIVDWVVGFTVAGHTEGLPDDVESFSWGNDYTTNVMGNPNAQAHLAQWLANQISYALDPSDG